MIDLTPIKARLAAATPGPWEQHPDVPRSIVATKRPNLSLLSFTQPPDDITYAVVMMSGDAEFIANAPTDISALIAEVERLRALLDEAQQERG